MDNDFTLTNLACLLADRDQPIKALLMDQTKIAGIGNTWSDEILFHARIQPAAAAGTLEQQQRALFNSIRSVFKTAIRLDPTTDDFQARLPPDFLLRHRHPGGHSPICGTELERVRISGHTATFCPRHVTADNHPR
jgi:formamidopyrimidine-DNA glycosylase